MGGKEAATAYSLSSVAVIHIVFDRVFFTTTACRSLCAVWHVAALLCCWQVHVSLGAHHPRTNNPPTMPPLPLARSSAAFLLIRLPGDAPDRHLQIRNITLRQLPQAHAAQVNSAGSSLRRLLQGAPRAANMVPLSTDMPPGSLTILLWPFNR